MQFPDLPALKSLTEEYDRLDLSRCVLIAIQHLLASNGSVFEQLHELGLPYQQMFLLGKVYSTNLAVYTELSTRGANCQPFGARLDEVSLKSDYRIALAEAAKEMLGQAKACLADLSGDKVLLIVDDGGVLIEVVNAEASMIDARIVAVEQTRSGAETVRNISRLAFPVVNVAESREKLQDESPYIATSILEHIEKKLAALQLEPISSRRALVVGHGAIGSQVAAKLKSLAASVLVYDTSRAIKRGADDLDDLLEDADLIVGCVGKSWFPGDYYDVLKTGVVLASGSSSNTEFLGIRLSDESLRPAADAVHADYPFKIRTGSGWLLNAGFPVNFDGSVDPIMPEVIVLTRLLMLRGVFQALTSSPAKGLISLTS